MGRYDSPILLATGASAEVYKAFDTVLQRPVALKLLRRAEPALVERMFREARAQARLDHEGICKIYEVGWLGDRPYISMQFVAGEELGSLHGALNLRQKVEVAWRTCRALEAAHAAGLVHRDVKPANVMVERRGEDLRPVIVDFGLVQEPEASELTEVGHVLGTPPYLAPEQIDGRSAVGPRTDVYGLGATLYELFCGRPLFSGENRMELVRQVLYDEPVPPRRLCPTLPPRIEAILQRCLEKRPERRYPTAAAVAEDLLRFLDGRRGRLGTGAVSGLLRRAGRQRRRRRWKAAAVVLLASSVLGVTFEGARRQADRAVEDANRYARTARDLDAMMRSALMSPAHEIRKDKEKALERIAVLEQDLAAANDATAGPLHFAIGSGYLAVFEEARALEHLQEAWNRGFQTPEAGFALGLSLSRAYEEELEQARHHRDPTLRAERVRQAEERWREPASRYLRAARGADSITVEHVEALVAVCEGRYEDALRLARAAVARAPWRHELGLLEGEVLSRLAFEKLGAGEAEEGFRLAVEGEAVFRRVQAVAPSDPRAPLGLCRLAEAFLSLGLGAPEEGGTPGASPRWTEEPDERRREGLAACRAAGRLEPSRVEALIGEARVHRIGAVHRKEEGRAALGDLARAEGLAARAVRLAPTDASAHVELGLARLRRAEYRAWHRSGDPLPPLAQAVESFQRAHALRLGDPVPLNHLGASMLLEAAELERQERDPAPATRQAVRYLEASLDLEPGQFQARHDLALAQLQRARLQQRRGQDFRHAAEKALAEAHRTLDLRPDSVAGQRLAEKCQSLLESADQDQIAGAG